MLRFTDFLSGGEQGLWGHLLAAGGEEVDDLGSLAWAVGAPALGPGLLGTVWGAGQRPGLCPLGASSTSPARSCTRTDTCRQGPWPGHKSLGAGGHCSRGGLPEETHGAGAHTLPARNNLFGFMKL